MSELALLTATSDPDSHPGIYALLRLSEANVRWFRQMLVRTEQMASENPSFIQIRFALPDGLIFWDPDLRSGMGRYGRFRRALEEDLDMIIVPYRDVPPGDRISESSQIVFKYTGFFWETPAKKRISSRFVSDDVVAQAWCLLCPAAERTEAFADLIRRDPFRAMDWLEAGVMHSYDKSVEIPLPPLSSNLLLPLLQHGNRAVRERALTALHSYPRPSAHQPRTPR